MSIPLRELQSPMNPRSQRRTSLDSELSAVLSYALGKEVPGDDTSSGAGSARVSSQLDVEEAREFLQEHDPLTAEYDPFPQRKVDPPLLPEESIEWLEITEV